MTTSPTSPTDGHIVAARRIGDVEVQVLTRARAIDLLIAAIDAGRGGAWGFCNAHSVNLARDDVAFSGALGQMTLLNDGIGVDIASRMLHGAPFPENLNGTDLTPALLSSLDQPTAVFLIGGKPGVAEAAAAVLATRFPNVRIAGIQQGFFGVDQEAAIIARIRASSARLVLVAMGQPRQEFWAVRHAGELGAVLLCVGAYLDFAAGRVSRAPALVQALRMEWAYRLLLEPRRLAKRYLVGNATFLAAVMRERWGRTRPVPKK